MIHQLVAAHWDSLLFISHQISNY